MGINQHERISASLVLGSYLDTLGFYNGVWEFNFNTKIKNLAEAIMINYEIVHHFFSLGSFNINISSWNASDDTIMMIATMKACKRGGNMRHFIDEYVKILPALEDEKRISGITTLKSLRILAKYKDASRIEYANSMGGNGAAMRTHYIGIHFKDNIKKIIEVSIMASRLTHNYPLGFLGGMTNALFTNYALNNIEPWKWCDMLIELNDNGTIDNIMKETDIFSKYLKDKDAFWTPWYKFREYRVKKFYLRSIEFTYGADRYNDLIKILYEDIRKVDYNRFGSNGASCMILALDSLLSCIVSDNNMEIDLSKPETLKYSWENLVFLSTLQFSDNDTIGAITGMLYGAYKGYEGVSKKVINMLEFKNELNI